MRIPRFFARPQDIADGLVRLAGEEAAHAVRVLRVAPGDRIAVLDDRGVEYLVEVTTATSGSLAGRVLSSRPRATEPRLSVTLAQGLPKGDKFESVVQKATEIGVTRIVPLLTARTVVDLSPAKALARVERWRRVALEAAKQAGRAIVPEVNGPMNIEALTSWWGGRGPLLVPWEEECTTGLREACEAMIPAQGEAELMIVIGPEGGLAAAEVDGLRAAGAVTITLGPRILRTETAGPVALACALLLSGDMA